MPIDRTPPPMTPTQRAYLEAFIAEPANSMALAKRLGVGQPHVYKTLNKFIPKWRVIVSHHDAGLPVGASLWPVWIVRE